MQRVGQRRDFAHAHGHFRNPALGGPQSREQGARHLAALDGLGCAPRNLFRSRQEFPPNALRSRWPLQAKLRCAARRKAPRGHARRGARAGPDARISEVSSCFCTTLICDPIIRYYRASRARWHARWPGRPPLWPFDPLPIIPSASLRASNPKFRARIPDLRRPRCSPLPRPQTRLRRR